ncbi:MULTISPECIES: NAD(P)/FAD-dependent oxidoreductase [Methylomonas]|uniref:Flavocytochrome c sulfide dehydrogenase flavin-binding protein n=2 Tax=Methylomonas TaxID=416 RepID=A0A140E3U2_9GAMM|nr:MULTISPECIES: NAD(P)/FAD-dependent oxidoreductase [Methylomonas]AMK75066.1 flavocytochrome c sulfide dehydrogenase flavin-binding protein [Methylomonas denitrificans]OAI02557.1 flavocytochrome c sulfide dehydrogenase flavin-binding protein [Methylomonas methanica]TCV83120.1 sulfide dehydrogenase (flavocytochrome c) flavoprotein subunit [Methylomonas methanica]
MAGLSRRRFLQGVAGLGAGVLSGCAGLPICAGSKAHVVVVGGGFGGATAAKYLRLLDANIRVTLIEPKVKYITCPGSNWLFAGLSNLDQLTVDYQSLQDRYGVKLLVDRVSSLDAAQRRLRLTGGRSVTYDRLIMSPGIDFRWDAIAGYDQAAAEQFPHAWQAGPQTLLLARQLQAMPDGGVVLIAVPADPYRCPPGPYERASMMAYWLKQHKPRSKILILDAKRSFSKQALFEAGWAKHYGYGTANSLIEWHSLADNPLLELNKQSRVLTSEFGDRFRGNVLNIIPPQTAAQIALQHGLTDSSGWCPVRPLTGESLFDEFIHVIGDAAHYAPIPKSAFAANSEAKACALAVTSLINQKPVVEPHWLNTCYSLIAPEHGVSVAGVYKLDAANTIVPVKGAGGVSVRTDVEAVALEADYTRAVYRSLITDTFG